MLISTHTAPALERPKLGCVAVAWFELDAFSTGA